MTGPVILSHLDRLEARYDGALPPGLRAAALALDAAEPPAAAAWPAPKRRFRSDAELVRLMARLMVERAAVSESCSDTDLACAGITRAERDAHLEAAQRLAATIAAPRGRR